MVEDCVATPSGDLMRLDVRDEALFAAMVERQSRKFKPTVAALTVIVSSCKGWIGS